MKSIKSIYRIGKGPSSSHTMAPRRAAQMFMDKYPEAVSFKVYLFSSMASTGKGHLTDKAVAEVLGNKKVEFIWKPGEELPMHPNGLRFEGFDANNELTGTWETYSIGGGALYEDKISTTNIDIYPDKNMKEIMERCEKNGLGFWEYVEHYEGAGIKEFLEEIWAAMCGAIERGLESKGVLPGSLCVPRKANSLFKKTSMLDAHFKQDGLLAAYAYSVAEENAGGGIIVTAPTCGSSGVIPAVLKYLEHTRKYVKTDILQALATAGLIGNIVKQNASISGAEVGCQGEIGAACAMAAGAAAQILGGSIRQIEYAAEMGLEHHLGLTCDPVDGLVQIPCIERNAHAAARALSCCHFSLLSDGSHKIPFDQVVSVLLETGHNLPKLYRETSAGGLAQAYLKNKCLK